MTTNPNAETAMVESGDGGEQLQGEDDAFNANARSRAPREGHLSN
jgi:hypothetical protein